MNEMRLIALREAAQIGISDINTGAFHRFASADGLAEHLASLSAELIAGK